MSDSTRYRESSRQRKRSTDSEVIQTSLDCVANVRGAARGQAVAEVNEISTRNDQQTIFPHL